VRQGGMVAKFNKKISKKGKVDIMDREKFKTFFPRLETKVLYGFQTTTIVQPLWGGGN
jgi:hypothetical protein